MLNFTYLSIEVQECILQLNGIDVKEIISLHYELLPPLRERFNYYINFVPIVNFVLQVLAASRENLKKWRQ
jgi:hypothetical protein